jgi:NhaP-type Na+/H+ or K+/H+ antiporter
VPSFQATAAVLGVVLIAGALVSGLAERSFLSLASLFVLVGLLLGDGGLQWLDFRSHSGFVTDLAFAALVVILFRDGLEVEGEMLQRQWRLPARKLVLAMPITAGLIAVAARLLFGLSWTESLLLGALLSPTDPVLTSSIVTNPRVPRLLRHSLNLESGLNDGLALPAVLAFAAALEVGAHGFVWWHFVLQDIGLGLLFGLACGLLASVLLPIAATSELPEHSQKAAGHGRISIADTEHDLDTTTLPQRARNLARRLDPPPLFAHSIPGPQRSLFALGAAFATYGLTVLSPHGNGFIAVFVAAIVLGIRRRDLRIHFEDRSAELVEIVKLGIFLVFGSLLTIHAFTVEGFAILGFVAIAFLIARPVAVWLALIGTATDSPTRLFLGWFGPKGVASMTFALLILDRRIASGQRIFDIAAFVVLCSIVIHGASDTPGANWIARRARQMAPVRSS